jgi:hypothetical protein
MTSRLIKWQYKEIQTHLKHIWGLGPPSGPPGPANLYRLPLIPHHSPVDT